MANKKYMSIEEMVSLGYQRAQEEDLFIEQLSENKFLVNNITNGSSYIVTAEDSLVINCECPHHYYRFVMCKHMARVSLEYGFDVQEYF